MRGFKILMIASLLLSSCASLKVKNDTDPFLNKLEKLFPTAEITQTPTTDHFKANYQIVLKQKLDHNDPNSGTFDQYVYLSHTDVNKPTLLVTEGYNAYPHMYELADYFQGNQVMVEYRFYGKSRPDVIPWEYLKNDQAIEDYHTLVEQLKTIYKGKWISTGISKGGETVLIYKSKYPEDMDAAVPYVAPLINTQEDPRTDEHINTVGSDECRKAIMEFQRLVLSNAEDVLQEAKTYVDEKKMSFTVVPLREGLEYAVLEFPFSFWQWGGSCEDIPSESSTAKEQFDYLNKIVGISFYSDATYDRLLPSYYQHMVELGYYGFDTTPVKDLLTIVHQPTNKRFAPQGVDLTYDPNYIKEVREYVETKGGHILYVYGEYDTWGACAPEPNPSLDALKMVLPKGSHATRIHDFPEAERTMMYDRLDKWLGAGTIKVRR